MFISPSKNIESLSYGGFQMGNIPSAQEFLARVYHSSNIITPWGRFRIIARVYHRANIIAPKMWFRIIGPVHHVNLFPFTIASFLQYNIHSWGPISPPARRWGSQYAGKRLHRAGGANSHVGPDEITRDQANEKKSRREHVRESAREYTQKRNKVKE